MLLILRFRSGVFGENWRNITRKVFGRVGLRESVLRQRN